jgi:MinD superfamily P-loop ATPase
VKEIVIVRGKGGTGKTTLCAAFAALVSDAVIADCDMDAADIYLLLDPRILHEADFVGGRTPVIDRNLCMGCGDCQGWCRFSAIDLDFDQGCLIDSLACEHCGLCALVCPKEAISMQSSVNGRWFISDTAHGKLVHARLKPGKDNSGKLVTLVRREARRLAEEAGAAWILNDGPPGVGCPVTAAITGVDLARIITEPTLSGIHDMQRVEALCRHFRVPTLVCINKFDINPENTRTIRSYCAENEVPIVGEIPFSPEVQRALVARKSMAEFDCGEVSRIVERIWTEIDRSRKHVQSGNAEQKAERDVHQLEPKKGPRGDRQKGKCSMTVLDDGARQQDGEG